VPDGELAQEKVGAEDGRPHYAKAFFLGIGLMAGNLTTVVLLMPATHEVAVSRADLAAKVVACTVLALAAVLPALLPPLLVTLGGDGGRRKLDQLADWMHEHQHRISGVVCLLFAAYLAATGIAKIS
jgi:hypothetical protein